MMTRCVGIWIVRPEAETLGRFLESRLGATLCIGHDVAQRNREQFAAVFAESSGWVLIMSIGIAVRYLQGLPRDKAIDPGVVVLDEAARFAVSLLGGHEGGANALAYDVANATGAIPVITTATEALRPLVVGIGCRKGVSLQQIEAAVDFALNTTNRTRSEIREIATIDLKAAEPALLEWTRQEGLPLRIIRRELIAARPWVTQPSMWVKANVGVDAVCEPCALLASNRGKLLLEKTVLNGVTVAIAEETELFK